MDRKGSWERFKKSGNIFDYLEYAKHRNEQP